MKRLFVFCCAVTLLLAAFSTPVLAVEDVTPSRAYELATTDTNVYILDVRTAAEWQWVGHPGVNAVAEGAALAGKVVNISYKIDKKGNFIVNPAFLPDVADVFEETPQVVLITMCRSGKRSLEAANLLEAAGYQALNMVTGFEGGKDSYGYRTVNGWRVDGLPYTYSGEGYRD